MSTVKVNTVDKRTGSTLTLGGCGTTVTLGAGATQSGFGRTGTVDWCTTAKTAPFTGVSGKGYFVNTTCGAVTVTLPATPSAGDIISVKDYAGTWNTNAITFDRNGSKINGGCAYNPFLTNQYGFISLIYVDATKGWLPTDFSTSSFSALSTHITATGGTITCCGDYKIHTFTSDGTFCVSAGSGPLAIVDYLVVAGGGGGGYGYGGAGGGGGYREAKTGNNGCYTVSPLATPIGLQMSIGAYPITVGAGGAASPTNATSCSGSNSIFSTITSTGGGGGGGFDAGGAGGPGGSGGGRGVLNPLTPSPGIGLGNTPPVSPPQGNDGGTSFNAGTFPGNSGGGGGGATAVGGNASCGNGGSGGAGGTSSINTTPTQRGGGGGGGSGTTIGTGSGGGGNGGNQNPANPNIAATAGTANTGGGGGSSGGSNNGLGGAGGSGIVIIRYKFQN